MTAEELFDHRIREFQIQLFMFRRNLPLTPTEVLDEIRQNLENMTLMLVEVQETKQGVKGIEPQWRS